MKDWHLTCYIMHARISSGTTGVVIVFSSQHLLGKQHYLLMPYVFTTAERKKVRVSGFSGFKIPLGKAISRAFRQA